MKTFVTLGDLIADFYLGIERFPVAPGQHQDVSALMLGPGGAGNALVAAARLGLPCVALGAVGEDWIGERVLAQLRDEGVDTSAVLVMEDEATTTAVVLKANASQHVFLGYPGARGPTSLPAAWREALHSAGVVLVDGWAYRQSWPDVIRAGVEAAASAGATVLFDPGPLGPALNLDWRDSILRAARVLLINDDEARALTGESDPRASLAILRNWGARTVIIKRGAGGCVIADEEKWIECPGYPVQAVDSIGAGDCFAAAVAWGLLHQQPWEVMGAVANAVGAAKVQKIGSALAAPTRAEVRAILDADHVSVTLI